MRAIAGELAGGVTFQAYIKCQGLCEDSIWFKKIGENLEEAVSAFKLA